MATPGARRGDGQGQEASLPPGGSPLDTDALAEMLKPLSNPVRLRMLDLMTRARYLEELASELGITRQAVRKHLDHLVTLGVVVRQEGRRASGPVTEYVLNRSRVFHLHTEFARLGRLRAAKGPEAQATIDQPTVGVGRGAGSRRGKPCLTVVQGLDLGRMYDLADQEGRIWRIGRAEDSEIRIDYDPFVSNRHAEVRRSRQGYVVVDAFSRNGTRLNWEPLPKGAETALEPGDILSVGKSLFVFQILREA